MKFSTRTLQILKSFVAINPSIAINEGNIISTINPAKTILAKATVQENIDKPFAIYELSKFLSTISLFQDPEFENNEKFMRIFSGKSKVDYYFASKDLIISPPEKEVNLPATVVSFTLSSENIQTALKALNTLNLPEIAFIGENGVVRISAIDSGGAVADTWSLEIGETTKEFTAVIKSDNLLIMPDNYEVDVTKAAVAFRSQDIEYIVALEAKSSKF